MTVYDIKKYISDVLDIGDENDRFDDDGNEKIVLIHQYLSKAKTNGFISDYSIDEAGSYDSPGYDMISYVIGFVVNGKLYTEAAIFESY